MLEIKNAVTGYGKVQILNGINLSVSKGQIIALLGGNGTGKSTLLKAISGLLTVWEGTIEFMGEGIQNQKPNIIVKKGLTQVTQGKDMYPAMTVEENLKIGAYTRSNKVEVAEDMKKVFDYFPRLKERRKQQARTLSGGEQQMVAIGRAVMAKPRLLLLDEPSGGLAPQFINEIGVIIQALKDDGATMLMVEQNLALAFKVADRFIILRDGTVSDGGFVKSLEGDHDDIVRTIYL